MKKIKSVDENGLEINKLKTWKEKNPSKIYFDSKFEWRCWMKLKNLKINFSCKPTPISLMKEFKTIGFEKNEIKIVKVRPMIYTPDFLVETEQDKFYIECKGYFRPVDRYRFKLCQYTLHTNKLGSILLIMNDLEFDRAISLITTPTLKKNKIKL